MWIDEELINEIMNTMIDLLWHDIVKNSFFTLFAIVLVVINNYFDLASMLVHDQHVVFITFKINQWKNQRNRLHENLILFYFIRRHHDTQKSELDIIHDDVEFHLKEWFQWTKLRCSQSSSKHRIRDVWIFVFSWSIFFSTHSTYIESNKKWFDTTRIVDKWRRSNTWNREFIIEFFY
jgi:hypothetical protein